MKQIFRTGDLVHLNNVQNNRTDTHSRFYYFNVNIYPIDIKLSSLIVTVKMFTLLSKKESGFKTADL